MLCTELDFIKTIDKTAETVKHCIEMVSGGDGIKDI